jgi:hypothetical protein
MASSNAPAVNETTIKSGGTWPVGQRASENQAAVATTAAASSAPWGFSSSTQANAIVTLLNEIRASLIHAGIMKGEA